MLTFTDLLEECQAQTGADTSTESQAVFTRGINEGLHIFRALMRREFTMERKIFSVVADQQYYQLPEDAIRLDKVSITVGSIVYPLIEVNNDKEWQYINSRAITSSIPQFYYIRGQDEFGIYPLPAESLSSAGELTYQARVPDIGATDYETGTVAVVNGSATVTGTTTVWTSAMVGRMFRIRDNSNDDIWYRITAVASNTSLTLENVYSGDNASGVSYTIGEVPNIPEEYHLHIADYGLYRYYMRRRDKEIAAMFKSDFENGLNRAKREYSSKSASQYVPGRRRIRLDNVFTREPDEVS